MNSFEGGMVSDLHVGSSPSNTVTNALNMELITVGEPVYFSKYKGQKHVLDLPSFMTATRSAGSP
jgi:energy-converting hydrogenase Eha subunit E